MSAKQRLTKSLIENIKTCEMWLMRHMAKVSWKERRNNADVLKKDCEERSLLNTIKSWKMKIVGQNKHHDSIIKTF